MNKISLKIEKVILYSLAFFCSIAAWGSLIYKFYKFNFFGLFLLIALSITTIIIILNLGKKSKNWQFSFQLEELEKKQKNTKTSQILTFFYFLISATLLYLIISSKTENSITSPWEVVPLAVFVLFFVSFFLAWQSLQGRKVLAFFILAWQSFLTFSVIVFVYSVGYGFDSYVHQASLEHIDRFSEVNPKPFYYLGFYSLIVFFKKLFFVPIALTNKFLIPVSAALLLPYFFLRFNLKWFQDNKHSFGLCLILLFLPFTFFTHTTPQNLAFLFLLITVLFSLTAVTKLDRLLLSLLALATFAIHPLSGIPAVLFVSLVLVGKMKLKILPKKIITILLLTANTLALPTIFIFLNKQFNALAKLDWNKILTFDFKFLLPDQENILLNTVYFWGNFFPVIFVILCLGGAFIFLKNRQSLKGFETFGLFFATSFVSYLITKSISFSYLVDYEQTDFAYRLFVNSLFFLIPFIILSIHKIYLQLKTLNSPSRVIIFTLLTSLITANFYLSYPRLDNYHNSHGLSVSKYDFEATKWINDNTDDDFVVLANQQVSAAALSSFGFKKYFKNKQGEDIFYYPIPTGGELYQVYLDMVYDRPSQKNATKAKELTGTEQVFFVLNKYWWAFDKLKEEARLEAKAEKVIGGEDVIIFEY